MQGGAFTTLGLRCRSPSPSARPIAFVWNRSADHIRVLVNNRPVIRVRDTTALAAGQPGIMMYRTQADYDNVVANTNPGFTAFFDDFEILNFVWTSVAGIWTRASTPARPGCAGKAISRAARAW